MGNNRNNFFNAWQKFIRDLKDSQEQIETLLSEWNVGQYETEDEESNIFAQIEDELYLLSKNLERLIRDCEEAQ